MEKANRDGEFVLISEKNAVWLDEGFFSFLKASMTEDRLMQHVKMSAHSCCGGKGCVHIQPDIVNQDSLYKYIDNNGVRALNERVDGSAAKILLPFDQKRQKELVCESEDDDEQMIIHVPFTASVKVTSICIVGDGATCPRRMHVWANRDDIDFDNCEDVKPSHIFDIAPNPLGEIQYPTDPIKFKNIHSLTLWISENHGGDQTAVSFLGFRGAFIAPRVGVVVATYESRAQLADHRVPDETKPYLHL